MSLRLPILTPEWQDVRTLAIPDGRRSFLGNFPGGKFRGKHGGGHFLQRPPGRSKPCGRSRLAVLRPVKCCKAPNLELSAGQGGAIPPLPRGFSSPRAFFGGFLPSTSVLTARKARLKAAVDMTSTLSIHVLSQGKRGFIPLYYPKRRVFRRARNPIGFFGSSPG